MVPTTCCAPPCLVTRLNAVYYTLNTFCGSCTLGSRFNEGYYNLLLDQWCTLCCEHFLYTLACPQVDCYANRTLFLYTYSTTLCRLIERLFVHFAIDLVYLLDLMKCTTHWTLSVHLIVPTTLVTCPRPDDVYYTLDAFCTLCTLTGLGYC